MDKNDRSLSNRNRSSLANERGVPTNSLALDGFYQKAKKATNRFVIGLKEYFDFLIHGDAEFEGTVTIDGIITAGNRINSNNTTFEINANVDAGGASETAVVEINRLTNTTGVTNGLLVHVGDGTSNPNHFLRGDNGYSYICGDNGKLAIGSKSAEADFQVDITGQTKMRSSLYLDGGVADSPNILILSTGFTTWNMDNSSGRARIYPTGGSGTEFNIEATTGNVGIGVTPHATEKVYVAGSQTNTGNMRLGYQIATTTVYAELGSIRTASGYALIDLIGDTTYTDYGLRLIRSNSGANANSALIHRGTGSLELKSTDGGVILLNTSNFVRAPSVYTKTTAAAANVYVASNGDLSRATSSKRYKKDIEPLDANHRDMILNLKPIFYRPIISENGKEGWSYYGFIAEDVAEIDPRFVDWEFGEYVEKTRIIEDPKTEKQVEEVYEEFVEHPEPIPTGVFYDRLVVPLIGLVKKQQTEIDMLKKELEEIKCLLEK